MNLSALIEFLMGSGTVVTVNARLARYLMNAYDEEMRRLGLFAWPTPSVFTLRAWHQNLWDGARRTGNMELMKEGRALAIWEGVLSNDEDIISAGVSVGEVFIQTSFDAYELLHEYRISLPDSALSLTEEANALKRWKSAYENKVLSLGALCPRKLPDKVIEAVKDGSAELPSSIIFAGFDSFSPRALSLIEAIKARGVETSFWPEDDDGDETASATEISVRNVVARSFADSTKEVVECARWIRETYRPGMRIAVVAPDLAAYREEVIREFNAELEPASALPAGVIEHSRAFNVSLATPLFDCRIVKVALEILAIGEDKAPLAGLFSVISSPYFSSTLEERVAIGRIDRELRKNNFMTAGLRDLLVNGLAAQSGLGKKIKFWLDSLIKWKGANAKARPGEWAQRFHALLDGLGWPGRGLALASAEYQALEKWNALLNEFAGLDDIAGAIDRASAVKKLSRMARLRTHQPQTPESPVQVLGVLEAAGQTFDKLWILGGHEHAFPLPQSPNPFIPIFLQKEKNIPGASYEGSIEEARRMAKRLLSAAPEVVVSHPIVVDDKEAKLSAVFVDFLSSVETPAPVKATHRLRDALYNARDSAVESLAVDCTVEIDGAELLSIKGGTAILREQSACPFRAFATIRLRARGLDEPEPGLSAMERGNLAHAVLENFWAVVKDSTTLKELKESERLETAIKDAVERVLKAYGMERRGLKHTMNIEGERLKLLLREWLLIESKRSDFKVISEETRRNLSFESGLTIKCKIDRVDELTDGTGVLIDYKTGECSVTDMLGERPREPQLLAYALERRYGAVAFASVKRGKAIFKGVAEKDDILPGVKAFESALKLHRTEGVVDYDSLMKRWEEIIRRLAENFASGDASVAPRVFFGKDSPCPFCELTALCRVEEQHKRERYTEED